MGSPQSGAAGSGPSLGLTVVCVAREASGVLPKLCSVRNMISAEVFSRQAEGSFAQTVFRTEHGLRRATVGGEKEQEGLIRNYRPSLEKPGMPVSQPRGEFQGRSERFSGSVVLQPVVSKPPTRARPRQNMRRKVFIEEQRCRLRLHHRASSPA